MTLVHYSTCYDEAIQGEPLPRLVQRPPLNTETPIWTIGDWPLVLPEPARQSVPRLERVIAEIRRWTGWSARRLADRVGCSHTTIINAEKGRPLVSGHSGDLLQRLVAVHDLVERVHLLAGGDNGRTRTLLETPPVGGRSAVDELLESGDAGRAYLCVLDVLRPRRPGLLITDRPRWDGPTTALHE
jgi:transcriptional regulator with XRE-family HTH domain